MERADYIREAKRAALAALDDGDPAGAVNRFAQTLNARADTFIHAELMWLAVKHLESGDWSRVRRWVELFPEGNP